MAGEPRAIEHFSRGDAERRLRQLHAIHQPDRTRDGELMYYSGQFEVWIGVSAEAGAYVLRYYDDCQCSG